MEVIWRRVDTGGYRQVQTNLCQRISALVRSDTPFKIGITSDPDKRASGYRSHNSQYDEMIVLYQTASERFIRQLEQDLIDYYEGWSYNVAKGQGRLGDPYFFLYVVRTKG